jgi:transposase/DNA-binding transcriptional regulator YdaS (Cro superfamily)
MRIPMEVREQLAVRFAVLLPHLNERQQRLALAVEARLLGHGGVRAVAQVAGVSETTVRKGVFELEAGEEPFLPGRVRRPGGGRKAAAQQDPDLVPALLALVEPDERGDPMSPLRWTTKSLRHLADELTWQGHPVSAPTVGKLLRELGFSLQANAKTLEGAQHPDRDAQFRYLNEQVKEHQAAGEPVISVDAKKKEMLGQLPNAGQEWRPKGQPIRVEDHSFFTSPQGEQAIPYGVYDLTTDTGWVNVGTDHDTSAFAVASIRRWWQARGHDDYPQATRLLITADAGGSNSYRYRAWKAELAALAAETGLRITVCHFPPGTSKWNKIEHRLFAHITMNWRGRPLTSHEVIVNTIAATRTRTGLRVAAALDTRDYLLGVSVSKARMDALPIQPHSWHGTWNYTIDPVTGRPVNGQPATTHHGPDHARSKALETLCDPLLTGMSRQELDALAARLAPAQAAQTEQRCYQQRGGRRRRAPGAGSRPLLGDADRILITIVYLRQVCSQQVLSEMLEVNPTSIGQAIAATRRLLEEQRHSVTPTTLSFSHAQDLLGYLDHGITVTRPRLPEVLSDPALTGMSRQELQQLTERLALRQAAQTERRRHKRRGRPRLPGTRGGIFRQKITDAERVLAAVLSQRGVCTRRVLAELLGVSPRTIGNALLDVRPLLEQDGYAIATAGRRFSTAATLLDFVNRQQHASPTKPPG